MGKHSALLPSYQTIEHDAYALGYQRTEEFISRAGHNVAARAVRYYRSTIIPGAYGKLHDAIHMAHGPRYVDEFDGGAVTELSTLDLECAYEGGAEEALAWMHPQYTVTGRHAA